MKFLYSLALAVFIYGCFEPKPKKTGLEGQPLPAFSLLLADSTTYYNTKNIPKGSPTVLLYVSPRCPYCKAQIKDIVTNITSLKNIQFYILSTYPLQELRSFYNYYGLAKYHNILMGYDYNYFFEQKFKPMGLPYTAIYGKDKKLNEVFQGKVSASLIKKHAFL
jgi:hypothetical protein